MQGLDDVTLIFLVDTSGSMFGQKIEAVNATIAECLAALREMSSENQKPKIGYATFDETMSSLIWERDVTVTFKVKPNSDGFYNMTSFSELYRGIGEIIHNTADLDKNLILILVTDGKPADSGVYSDSLERTKSLNVFRNAEKYVAMVGNDVNAIDNDVLEFVGFKADRVIPLSNLSGEISRMPIFISGNVSNSADADARYNSIFGD